MRAGCPVHDQQLYCIDHYIGKELAQVGGVGVVTHDLYNASGMLDALSVSTLTEQKWGCGWGAEEWEFRGGGGGLGTCPVSTTTWA
jgi:hypothetical protein